MTDAPPPAAVGTVDMVHHLLCAYVGPPPDFRDVGVGNVCPKCARQLKPGASDWEVLVVAVAESR